jgi:hypothetical protein
MSADENKWRILEGEISPTFARLMDGAPPAPKVSFSVIHLPVEINLC